MKNLTVMCVCMTFFYTCGDIVDVYMYVVLARMGTKYELVPRQELKLWRSASGTEGLLLLILWKKLNAVWPKSRY